MIDSLELLTNRGKGKPRGDTEADEDECKAFGFLRGIRDRALAIEFRLSNGNIGAYPYSWLGPVNYNPSAGLLLKFVGDLVYLVLIEGSNLNVLVKEAVNLYSGVLRHRVTWVREMSRQDAQRAGEAGEVAVERFRFLVHRPDEEPRDVEWLAPFHEPA